MKQLGEFQKFSIDNIAEKWDRLLSETGQVDIVNLGTSVGKLTFQIVSSNEEGFIGKLDENTSQLPESYVQLKKALSKLSDKQNDESTHEIVVFINRRNGRMSFRVLKRKDIEN